MNNPIMRKGGFTLVEVALALLVISVGLLAIFGLFPTALGMNKQAIDDTYAALFAEEALSGYKAQIAVTPWRDITRIVVLPRSDHMWEWTEGQEIQANVGWQTVIYRPLELDGDIEFAVRYNLQVDYLEAPDGTQPRAYAILEVLSGEYGPTNNLVRFYTEFLNTKRASELE